MCEGLSRNRTLGPRSIVLLARHIDFPQKAGRGWREDGWRQLPGPARFKNQWSRTPDHLSPSIYQGLSFWSVAPIAAASRLHHGETSFQSLYSTAPCQRILHTYVPTKVGYRTICPAVRVLRDDGLLPMRKKEKLGKSQILGRWALQDTDHHLPVVDIPHMLL